MKKILLTALVASVMFSCNNKEIDGIGNQDGTSSVVIKLEQTDLTKGISPEKGDPEYAVIKSAILYFIDAGGNKVYQRELSTAEITSISNTTTTPGGNTIEISGIPNTSETLYFLANVNTAATPTFPVINGTGSTGARLRLDDLQGDAMYAPMAGQSSTFTPVGGSSVDFTTTVAITPIVARIEVNKISCVELIPGAPSNIESYKLSGVFVNYARPSVLVSGAPYTSETPGDIRNQSGWGVTGWDSYLTGNLIFPYFTPGSVTIPTGWKDSTYVDYCSPANSALSFYPNITTGATSSAPTDAVAPVWAYQVCPTASAAELPHLIFKLTEVDYKANPEAASTEYLTITKYKDENGNPITEFKQGNVYRIENLMFTHKNATPKPYEENIVVTATVTVVPWVLNTMTPDWD